MDGWIDRHTSLLTNGKGVEDVDKDHHGALAGRAGDKGEDVAFKNGGKHGHKGCSQAAEPRGLPAQQVHEEQGEGQHDGAEDDRVGDELLEL